MSNTLKPIRIAIIAIGDELLSGRTIDTNSNFIAHELEKLGCKTIEIVVVADEEPAIAAAIMRLLPLVDVIVTSGGLGPTSDDLTRNAVSSLFATPLEEDSASRKKLEEHAQKRGRPLNENNLRQAFFPRGAVVLPNPAGTANIFLLDTDVTKSGSSIFCLPGVPREFRELVHLHIVPFLLERFPRTSKVHERCLRIFGLSEAHLGSVIERCDLPQEVQVGYRPKFPEVTISLRVWESEKASAESLVESAREQLQKAIGTEFVHAEVERTMAESVDELLKQKNMTLSLAESCTGGMIASRIVSIPGSSKYFRGSVVCYAEEAKEVFLGVHSQLIERCSVVSREVAKEMAYGARIKLGADIGISVTGIAGPTGGSKQHPVGTVFFGISTTKGTETFGECFPMERNAFRNYCSTLALDLIRRTLLGYPLQWKKL